MIEIYLCRHGQSVANAAGMLAGHIDSPLTDVGKQQAEELGHLANAAGLSFDHVYSSPLRRAKQTALVVAKMTGSPPPDTMPELIERDFGILTGKSYKDIPKLATEVLGGEKINYFLAVEGSETFPQALKRAQKVLKIIHTHHKNGKILLATHGDIGIMIFAAFHKTPWKDALSHFEFGNSDLLLLKEDFYHKPHVFVIDQRGIKQKD